MLLTDGENNTGRPVDFALRELKAQGIKTYFIGVEVVMGTTVENQGFNEATALISGITATGGKYFDARDAGQLRRAYQERSIIWRRSSSRTKERCTMCPAFAPLASSRSWHSAPGNFCAHSRNSGNCLKTCTHAG